MTTDSLFDVSQEIVLITGSSGQLGGEYAKIFLERGANVIGLDVRPSSNTYSGVCAPALLQHSTAFEVAGGMRCC